MGMVEVTGEIIPNDYAWIYDWFEIDYTTPNKIKKAIADLADGEELEVRINSYGGDVASGQEIYSLLETVNSKAMIMGQAASAAGFLAMGAKRVEISAVGTIMVHNVWCGGVSGDYHEMDKASEMLKSLNASIASAFVKKTGKSEEEILEMMDRETWLTANQAVEAGIADAIIGSAAEPAGKYRNALFGCSVTPEMIEQAKAAKAKEEEEARNRARACEELTSDLDLFGI